MSAVPKVMKRAHKMFQSHKQDVQAAQAVSDVPPQPPPTLHCWRRGCGRGREEARRPQDVSAGRKELEAIIQQRTERIKRLEEEIARPSLGGRGARLPLAGEAGESARRRVSPSVSEPGTLSESASQGVGPSDRQSVSPAVRERERVSERERERKKKEILQ